MGDSVVGIEAQERSRLERDFPGIALDSHIGEVEVCTFHFEVDLYDDKWQDVHVPLPGSEASSSLV